MSTQNGRNKPGFKRMRLHLGWGVRKYDRVEKKNTWKLYVKVNYYLSNSCVPGIGPDILCALLLIPPTHPGVRDLLG